MTTEELKTKISLANAIVDEITNLSQQIYDNGLLSNTSIEYDKDILWLILTNLPRMQHCDWGDLKEMWLVIDDIEHTFKVKENGLFSPATQTAIK